MQFASAARRYFHTQTITNETGEQAETSSDTTTNHNTTGLLKVRERTEEKHTDPKPAAPSQESDSLVGERKKGLKSGEHCIYNRQGDMLICTYMFKIGLSR